METVARLLLFGMVVPATGFPLLYSTFFRWWRNPIGRALMTKAIGLALLVDLSVVPIILGHPDYEYPAWVQVFVFVFVCAGLWYQFIVFLRIRFGRSA